jgi:dTDP-4-dehydrorhamnose 3,5-epimerase
VTDKLIEGVKAILLKRHGDERGWFAEIARKSHIPQFGQWSVSYMHTGVIKAWHLHHYQTDYWCILCGNIKAVLAANGQINEFFMGEYNPLILLKIPPGVAHGLKVLQGPAMLCYLTSEVYNPDDELRIPYNDKGIGYDWHKEDIR